ncbi:MULTISPECIES: hypothetical protein [unclassified Streptomyces]|uniref:hypothetical protein n=1 Tax=unclassified Streptomyces TaxID=2593676 RepID=UPI00081DE350|nr:MULTISPECIES: hypothetical protein [unclassified Streptomyces]MYZ39401.1 hypothetical protein [Streptomyces sp. SID4917]SCG03608.1 hypothetical protein GA0115259_1084210 [Streptomyces sp. MnatMP-M17]
MTGPSGGRPPHPRVIAFVESPVQLLNVLEWARASATGDAADALTVVVLSPTDPMSRGQLRRMAELARDEGFTVRWQDARGGAGAPLRTIRELAPLLRKAGRIVIGDPFSRYVQLLLTLVGTKELTVVDDGTATVEFIGQIARGERLVRWHRRGGSRGPRELVLAPVTAAARRRLTPSGERPVEVFTSMPVEDVPDGITVTANRFEWTRATFGPPRVHEGADMVGTSLVETGVVDADRYLEAVAALARTHKATRYFAHRRESADKLHRLHTATGLEIVRPDLPLELIARRGPIGSTILSFPSTVVHTLPLALAGTGVRVAVCDIAPEWLKSSASPRAQGFLSGVTTTARDVHRLPKTASPA